MGFERSNVYAFGQPVILMKNLLYAYVGTHYILYELKLTPQLYFAPLSQDHRVVRSFM